jgi:two-component system, sensor histidine kinase
VPTEAPPKRVLIVEDDEDSAELLAETFQLRGYQVHVAHDGATALAVAAQFLPHVALLDLGLPDMDGRDLARQLRTAPGVPLELRLIALTGYSGAETHRALFELGFDECLIKPAHPEALMQAIEGTSARAPAGRLPTPR